MERSIRPSSFLPPPNQLRYANNSHYKNDTMIRKEVFVGQAVMDEFKRIIAESEVLKEDDNNWPAPDRVGRQVRGRGGVLILKLNLIIVHGPIGGRHFF